MIEVKRNRKILEPLYANYCWNYLVEAILDGTMGKAWVDRVKIPQVGVIGYPRVQLYIVSGDPTQPASRDFLANLPKPMALVFASPGWEAALKQAHQTGIVELTRYAFSSESLQVDRLREFAARVPAGYRLERMTLSKARQLSNERSRFSEDHFLNYDSIEQFINRGFGYSILQGDKIVSAATTFVVCQRGIEIQINTREEHQRRGLATAVAAQLILSSLEKGLDPNWDAANEISAKLAVKLGYTAQGNYTMYLLTDT